MRRLRKPKGDAGETLLELVVAITILAVVVVSIASGVIVSIKTSRIHQLQSTAQQFLRNYAESIAQSYTACSGSTAPNYVTVGALPTPNGFGAPSATVKFWDSTAAAFSGTSCPGTDPGLQQVTLTLDSSDGFVRESLITVVRKST